MTQSARKTIIQNFAHAAAAYDEAASVQARVAARLVQKAAAKAINPQTILDLGCGTGLVIEAASHYWPRAQITAIDGAAAMLHEAQRKFPHLQVIKNDIAKTDFEPVFDLVLSSMA